MRLPQHYVVPATGLHAGEYPGHRDAEVARAKLEALAALGIGCFIDLTEEGELAPYASRLPAGVEHHRFDIRDMSVPVSTAAMRAILDAIDDALARGRRPYVHCWGGVGRTGTVVACHLVRREGLSGDEALARLAELFRAMPKSLTRTSPETPEQLAFVMSWPLQERPPSTPGT